MAFDVTPTSGEAPYLLTATIANAVNVDGVRYSMSVRSLVEEGSCPAFGNMSPLSQGDLDTLLAGGAVTTPYPTVPDGSCRAITLRLTRLSDGVGIQTETITVNNL